MQTARVVWQYAMTVPIERQTAVIRFQLLQQNANVVFWQSNCHMPIERLHSTQSLLEFYIREVLIRAKTTLFLSYLTDMLRLRTTISPKQTYYTLLDAHCVAATKVQRNDWMHDFQQVAKKASVLRKRKSKLKLDPAQTPSLSTSQINVSNNPAAAESDEVLCDDEEHKSGKLSTHIFLPGKLKNNHHLVDILFIILKKRGLPTLS